MLNQFAIFIVLWGSTTTATLFAFKHSLYCIIEKLFPCFKAVIVFLIMWRIEFWNYKVP